MPVYLAGGRIVPARANEKEAREQLGAALGNAQSIAAETLGHVDYKDYGVAFADWLGKTGDVKEAGTVLNSLYEVLSQRKVLQSALEDLKVRRDIYRSMRTEGKTTA